MFCPTSLQGSPSELHSHLVYQLTLSPQNSFQGTEAASSGRGTIVRVYMNCSGVWWVKCYPNLREHTWHAAVFFSTGQRN